MAKPLILVTSITYAMKGRDLLNNKGINASLERTVRLRNAGGCGYGLYVPKRTDEAEILLKQAGIRILGRMDREEMQ